MMKKLVSLVAVCLTLMLAIGCTDEPHARRVLDDEGYTDVVITGYVWAACADSDATHTGFTAKNAKGKQVSGVVCCGAWLKACTVRW